MFLLMTPEERIRQSEEWLRRIIEGEEKNPFGDQFIEAVRILMRLFAGIPDQTTDTGDRDESAKGNEGEGDHVV